MQPGPKKRKTDPFRLDPGGGVIVYRQVIDQVIAGIASGSLACGDQLPTGRQLPVDLSINPNTVIRAYRELEIRGLLETQHRTPTFMRPQKIPPQASAERSRRLAQL